MSELNKYQTVILRQCQIMARREIKDLEHIYPNLKSLQDILFTVVENGLAKDFHFFSSDVSTTFRGLINELERLGDVIKQYKEQQ